MSLQDSVSKIREDTEECWPENVDSYNHNARDYSHLIDQKRQYMHGALWNYALWFCLSHDDPYASTFQLAIKMVGMEYNFPVHQSRYKSVSTRPDVLFAL